MARIVDESGEIDIWDSEFEEIAHAIPEELTASYCLEEGEVLVRYAEPVTFESNKSLYIVELSGWLSERGYYIRGVKEEESG